MKKLFREPTRHPAMWMFLFSSITMLLLSVSFEPLLREATILIGLSHCFLVLAETRAQRGTAVTLRLLGMALVFIASIILAIFLFHVLQSVL